MLEWNITGKIRSVLPHLKHLQQLLASTDISLHSSGSVVRSGATIFFFLICFGFTAILPLLFGLKVVAALVKSAG